MPLPPGPDAPAALQTVRWIRRPFEFLEDCAARFGEIFTMRVLYFGSVVQVSNPEVIREVFASSPERMCAGQANIVLRPFLGRHSMLVLDGAEHQRQRRLIMPAFHGDRLAAYGRTMIDLCDAMIDRLDLRRPFAIHPHMQQFTLQVIMRTVFGIEEGPRADELSQLLRDALESGTSPPLLLPPLQRDLGPWSPWGRFQRLVRRGDEVLREYLHERRASADLAQRNDILSMLLQARDEAGQPMTDDELRDELQTLLVAGHETTATALCWALRWLLVDPPLCGRLRAELREAIDTDGTLLPDRVARLELLDAAVREVLRLQPVVPLVGRVLQEPMQVLGYDLPAGTVLAPSIYLAHRRPSVYKDPTRFRPERFFEIKPGPAEWFPFGGGVRRCVGAAFAQYEMKMALAALLSRTQMELAPGYVPRVMRRSVTLTPTRGLPVIMHSRLGSRQ